MRKVFAALVAGIVLGSAGVASAKTFGWYHNSHGVACKQSGGDVSCVPATAEGYGVGINRNFVIVVNLQTGKTVFRRLQP